MAGVDVQQRKRHARGRERLARQPREHDRILAAGKQQRDALELRGDLAKHMDAFAFKQGEVALGGTLHGTGSIARRGAYAFAAAVRPLVTMNDPSVFALTLSQCAVDSSRFAMCSSVK